MSKWKRSYPYSDRIYGALPYFYLGIGVLTMVLLPNAMGIFSGLTLMSAAGLVWGLRHHHRRPVVQRTGRIAVPPAARSKAPTLGLVQISWQKSYECGHPAIDAQHRRLFGFSNELINALMSDTSKFELECLLTELVDQVTDHFRTEEVELAKIDKPLSIGHQEHHRSLLTKARRLRDQYHNGQVVARDLVTFIAHEIIADHILEEAGVTS